MRAAPTSVKHLALLLLVLAGSASMCLYWSRITDAVHASPERSAPLKPKVLTDIYPTWYATRELLLRHRDPYGAEVNRELQIAYYGKELDPSRPEERQDQQRFVYPLYFIFLIFPLAWMQFHTAHTIFWWVLAVCAVLNVLLWLRFLRLRMGLIGLALLFVLVLTSIPVIQNLSILQPFLLPACFIAGAAAAAVSGRLFLAGTLLAVATVKPQICLLPLAWFALWVGSDWRHRRAVLWGFIVTLAALILSSEFLLPGWLIRYPSTLRAYAEYTKTTSFLGMLFPSPLNWLVTIAVLGMVAEFCWRVRRQPADSQSFAIALALVLTLTVMITPAVVQPFNHVLLLPAVLLAIHYWQTLRQGNALRRSVTSIFALSTFLPWALAAVAVANPLKPQREWLLKVWSLPLAASMALPFAAFGTLILLCRTISSQPRASGT
jgi:hypothetical protein